MPQTDPAVPQHGPPALLAVPHRPLGHHGREAGRAEVFEAGAVRSDQVALEGGAAGEGLGAGAARELAAVVGEVLPLLLPLSRGDLLGDPVPRRRKTVNNRS